MAEKKSKDVYPQDPSNGKIYLHLSLKQKATIHVFKIKIQDFPWILWDVKAANLHPTFPEKPAFSAVQSEASAAWAHRRRKQLPNAVARACRVPGAELWVTRRQSTRFAGTCDVLELAV